MEREDTLPTWILAKPDLLLTGSITLYDLSDISVEKSKELPTTSLYDKVRDAIYEAYVNCGYEILENIEFPPEISVALENKELYEAVENRIRDRIKEGDYNLMGNISFFPTDDFGRKTEGMVDFYVDSDINLLKEFEKTKKEMEETKDEIEQDR